MAGRLPGDKQRMLESIDRFLNMDPSDREAFIDPAVATTHLRIGVQVQNMTDEEILLIFNQMIAPWQRHGMRISGERKWQAGT